MPMRSGKECSKAFVGSYEDEVQVTVQNLGCWRCNDNDKPALENCSHNVNPAKKRLYLLKGEEVEK